VIRITPRGALHFTVLWPPALLVAEREVGS
jgi:hypothetical protein